MKHNTTILGGGIAGLITDKNGKLISKTDSQQMSNRYGVDNFTILAKQ